ncbi:nitroreductase family protein [Candidatus Bathyarchaeota archaeon]|nr:nitroreductase family protein [Candidatus Bathyarchaeota archaeon]
MEALDAILTRRSIRDYTDETVSSEEERQLLEAAMAAPSAHNKQPWHFIVIRDKGTLSKIPEYHQYSKMLKQASLGIVICGDHDIQNTDFWIHDCSAATENILIAANAMGLGAVWLGVHPSKDLINNTKELLGIPDNITPLGIVSVGYPASEKPPRKNYNPERIHRDKW